MIKEKIKFSPVKYFNARLLHYSGRFATNSEYLLFAQFVLEQKKVADSINIALKKIQGQPITATQIKSDVDKLKSMVCQKSSILIFEANSWYTTLLAKIHVRSGCNGKTTWCSNMVYDIVMY